jgi:uncharacterized protein
MTTLEAFLSRPGLPEGTLSLGEVQGFLFALAAAPDFVKPSEWLPMIFGDEEPGFETMEEGQEVMGLVLALYNEKLGEVRDEGPRMPEGCEFRDDLLANLEPDAPVAQWSRGFRTGHLWLEDSWEANLPEELKEELGAIVGTLTFFSSRALAEGFARELRSAGASLESLAGEFRDLFPNALARYAAMGTSIWDVLRKRMEGPPGPAVAKARPGRNKPCPCGSGRKYKKCCGAKVR